MLSSGFKNSLLRLFMNLQTHRQILPKMAAGMPLLESKLLTLNSR
jgi:hypothetical protein